MFFRILKEQNCNKLSRKTFFILSGIALSRREGGEGLRAEIGLEAEGLESRGSRRVGLGFGHPRCVEAGIRKVTN